MEYVSSDGNQMQNLDLQWNIMLYFYKLAMNVSEYRGPEITYRLDPLCQDGLYTGGLRRNVV